MEFLKKCWKAWKNFARALGKVQTAVLLILFYFLILGPAALISWLLRRPVLPYRSSDPETYWKLKAVSRRGEAQYYEQY